MLASSVYVPLSPRSPLQVLELNSGFIASNKSMVDIHQHLRSSPHITLPPDLHATKKNLVHVAVAMPVGVGQIRLRMAVGPIDTSTHVSHTRRVRAWVRKFTLGNMRPGYPQRCRYRNLPAGVYQVSAFTRPELLRLADNICKVA